MARRFYWLKLKEDFFKSKEVKKLRRLPGGGDYTVIYLKMLIRSLQADGRLYFDGIEETFAEEIALDIDEDVDAVRMTVAFLIKNGLMQEESETEVRLTGLDELVGSEGASAHRVRAHRERKRLEEGEKALLCNTDVTNGNTEKEKEIEKELEIEIETETEGEIETETEEPSAPEAPAAAPPVPYEEIRGLYHGICTSYPRVVSMSTNRKKAIAARWKEYSYDLEIFRELFERAEESAFLKGVNDRNWIADFDWLMKSDNMAKVLEGKYDGQRRKPAAFRSGSGTIDVLKGIVAAEEAAVSEAAYTVAE